MPPPSLNDIAKLLVSTHTTDELRALVRDVADDVVETLPEGKGTLAVAERVAEGVIHRGMVDALHDRLLVDRPGRAHDIGVLFGRAADSRKREMTEAVDDALRDVEDTGEPRSLDSYLQGAGEEQEDLLYETFRSMAFGKSRASWPYTARMTADYLKNRGGKPDAFFKRVAWLLERCEDEDVVALRSLSVVTSPAMADGNVQQIRWTVKGGNVQVMVFPKGGKSPFVVDGDRTSHVDRRHARDVLALITESRLVVTGTSLGGGSDHAQSVQFKVDDGHLDRLLALFRV